MKRNAKRVVSILLAMLICISMSAAIVLPAAAGTDPYALVTGTTNDDGHIIPDSNVTFIFAAQPEGASETGFAYEYIGNGKTYWLKWGTNATLYSEANLKAKIDAQAQAWAKDTTGTVSRDAVFVFAPGEYKGTRANGEVRLAGSGYTRAATGVNPTIDEMPNVYFLGAKAGVSPVSDDRSDKEAAKKVANGRTNDYTKNESVLTGIVAFPKNCNFYMDGFSAKGVGTFFAHTSSLSVNVNIKNHYVANLTGNGGYNCAIVRVNGNSRAMYEFENSYFDMNVPAASAAANAIDCNKLVFNNCAFVNAVGNQSQTLYWYPHTKTNAATYANFLGQYYANPTYQIKNSIFADWKDAAAVKIQTGSRTYNYGTFGTKVDFSNNAVFDCGQTEADSAVFQISATERVSDFDLSIQNNKFGFADAVFGTGASGNSYAIDLGDYAPEKTDCKITFVGNEFSVPADGKTQVFAGVSHDCTGWTKSENVLKTNGGETLKIAYPIVGHAEGELIVDTPPTATMAGKGHTVCTKCGDEIEYILAPGEAQIGETLYPTLQEALAAAKAGDAVIMKCDVQQSVVTVYPGVTLDLNGYQLTADYVVGLTTSAIIDSSKDNTAKLIVDKNAAAMDRSNQGYVPVYDQDGYIFTTIGLTNRSKFVTEDEFRFSPVFESFAHDALYEGKARSGVEILIRLRWKREGNYEGVQEFIYLDDKVQHVIESYIAEQVNYSLAFNAKFSGGEAESDPNMEVTAVIRSATGVEIDTSSTVFDEDNIVFSFGSISDTHVRVPSASVDEANRLREAIEKLKEQALINDSDGLDTLAISGDLTDMGTVGQAEVFVDILKKSGVDSTMITFGNHEYNRFKNPVEGSEPAMHSYYLENMGELLTKNATDMSLFEKGAYHCEVNGNHFIMIQPSENSLVKNYYYFPYDAEVIAWLDTTLKNITAADPTSYVFVFTHIPLINTTDGTYRTDQDVVGKFLDETLNKYPQAMLFTGHLHRSLQDERNIMQTEFTHVHNGSTKNSMGNLVQVDANGNVRITRMYFSEDAIIKEPWELSHPTADKAHLVPYSREYREADNLAPTLGGELKASATSTAAESGFTADVTLSFAAGQDDDMVHSYKVTVTDVNAATVQTKIIESDYKQYAHPSQMATELTCTISLECTGASEYTIDVVAVDSWDAESDKISCNLTIEPPQA